jgi:hypothetical protein
MQPIEPRAGLDFDQALRCVEFRVPRQGDLRENGYALAVALRYGLMGAAAVHHLLLSTNDEDERLVLESAKCWSRIVNEHFRASMRDRLPIEIEGPMADSIGTISVLPIQISLHLYRRLCPAETCLATACHEFVAHHRDGIRRGWGWLGKRQADRAFQDSAETSLTMACRFFQRRQHGLDEVREIALLGE